MRVVFPIRVRQALPPSPLLCGPGRVTPAEKNNEITGDIWYSGSWQFSSFPADDVRKGDSLLWGLGGCKPILQQWSWKCSHDTKHNFYIFNCATFNTWCSLVVFCLKSSSSIFQILYLHKLQCPWLCTLCNRWNSSSILLIKGTWSKH